jgi:hypothetical protein
LEPPPPPPRKIPENSESTDWGKEKLKKTQKEMEKAAKVGKRERGGGYGSKRFVGSK